MKGSRTKSPPRFTPYTWLVAQFQLVFKGGVQELGLAAPLKGSLGSKYPVGSKSLSTTLSGCEIDYEVNGEAQDAPFLHLPRNTLLKPIAGPLKNQEAPGTHTRKK